jgi:hypothetical protein
MEKFDFEYFEKKYPGISDKEGWLDLHLKKGSEEIIDEEFKKELMNYGMESEDVDSYIQILNDLNNDIEDIAMESKMVEMFSIIIGYDDYLDKEPELKRLVKAGNVDDAQKILENELNMTTEDIEIVLANINYQIKTENEE